MNAAPSKGFCRYQTSVNGDVGIMSPLMECKDTIDGGQ
jgi:hypothetical protein